MVESLGARLVRAGLVTRELLAAANAQSEHEGTGLAEALVACGLSDDALVRYMLADGHGPLLDAPVLAGAERSFARRVGRAMADAFLALPVGTTPEGVVVAMADPSDERALRELRHRLESPVVAKVARVRDLRSAIDDALRDGPAPAARTPARTRKLRGATPIPFSLPDKALEDQSWDALVASPPAPPPRVSTPSRKPHPAPAEKRARFGPKPPIRSAAVAPGDLGLFLAGLRGAVSRDDALRTACEAALTVGGTAVFLGVRKGLLVGWDGLGPGISRDALRNLWIPVTTPSVLKRVIDSGAPHWGPHGAAPADQLFRAATGCRGSKLAVHAVFAGDKAMGLLCVDDPRYAESGQERLAVLTHALGEALKRLILARKG
jgi:hypothetical protein